MNIPWYRIWLGAALATAVACAQAQGVPAANPDAKPIPKPDDKAPAAQEAKPAAKSEARPSAKSEAKPTAKSDPKSEAKAATKPEAKPGVNPDAKPAAKPSAKAAAKKPAAGEDNNAGVKALEEIFTCVATGLPKDWRRAWVVVTEIAATRGERTFDGKFNYALDAEGKQPLELMPCDAKDVARRVYALNDFLDPAKRGWKSATLIFLSDGKFELKYDYTP